MMLIIIDHTTQRVPPVTFVDVNCILQATVVVLREYIEVANLQVVSEIKKVQTLRIIDICPLQLADIINQKTATSTFGFHLITCFL